MGRLWVIFAMLAALMDMTQLIVAHAGHHHSPEPRTTHAIIRQYTIPAGATQAPPVTVQRIVATVAPPTAVIVHHVQEQVPTGCGEENIATTRPCKINGRMIYDASTCALRADCCFDERYSYCYRRRMSVSTLYPKGPRSLTNVLLQHGGEPGYPGSSISRSCGVTGRPCGAGAATESSCRRHACCFNRVTSQCYQPTFRIIRLRDTCAPGFINPPRCEDVNECSSNPCMNNGVCANEINQFKCTCPPGISGDLCENVCPSPPNIGFGAITGTVKPFYNVGETVTYACNSGYAFLSGTASSVCLISTAWSQPNGPVCVRVCPDPPITVGLIFTPNLDHYNINDNVQYSCPSGHHLVGDSLNFCLTTGQWSNQSPPSCYDCSAPPAVTSGLGFVVAPLPGYATNAVITYACTKGYTLDGTETNKCLGNNQWENAAPVCNPTVCGPPPTVAGAQYIYPAGTTQSATPPSTVAAGESVTYVCTGGLYLEGNANNLCIPSLLTYSNPAGPTCNSGCSTAPVPGSNGQVSPSGPYAHRAIATYSCTGNNMIRAGEDSTLECRNAAWLPATAPVCVPACPAPAAPAGGSIVPPQSFFLPGTQVQLRCPDGFTLNGLSTQTKDYTCPSSAPTQFPATPTTCDTNCASLPPAVRGGTAPTGTPPFIAGSTVTYGCESTYALNGPGTIACLATGAWDTSGSACLRRCSNEPLIIDGVHTIESQPIAGELTEGTILKYTCNPQFSIDSSASDTLTCQSDGQWSPNSAPTCRAVCQTPAPLPTIGVGSVSPAGNPLYVTGNEITYTCTQPDFYVQGDRIRTCQADNHWSGNTPSCIKDCLLTDLPNPQPSVSVSNYDITATTSSPNTVATYACSSGYEPSGSVRVTCGNNGVWDGTSPTCLRDCAKPADIPYGSQSPVVSSVKITGEYVEGTQVSYTCASNDYVLTGASTITCQSTGSYTPGPPECKRICPQPPATTSSTAATITPTSAQYLAGSVVTYTCPFGSTIAVGGPERTCLSTGAWSGSLPSCYNDCPTALPTATNGGIQGTLTPPYPYNYMVTYTCLVGYAAPVTQRINTCKSDGTWSSPGGITCYIKCPAAPLSGSGGSLVTVSEQSSLVTGTYVDGAIASYSCGSNYKLDNTGNRRTCLNTGAWNIPTAPSCLIECPALATETNGQRTNTPVSNYNPGDLVQGVVSSINCNPNFAIDDSATNPVTCQSTGQWSATPPTCIATCAAPTMVATGISGFSPRYTNYVVSNVVTYSCNTASGYTLDGFSERTCTAGSPPAFSPAAEPTCVLGCSTSPPAIAPAAAGGFVETVTPNAGTSYSYQTSFTYSCSSAYVMSVAQGASATTTCQQDRSWSEATAPTCYQKCSNNPPDKANAGFAIDNAVFESHYVEAVTVTYTCSANYKFDVSTSPVTTITCNSGAWTTGTSACLSSCDNPVLPTSNGGTPTHTPALDHYVAGNTYTWSCASQYSGYSGTTPTSVNSCNAGTWTVSTPRCAKQCSAAPSLPSTAHGTTSTSHTIYEPSSTVTYTCSNGYSLSGTGTVTCTDAGTWDVTDVSSYCLQECSSPPSHPSGSSTTNSLSIPSVTVEGDVATYTCDTNYNFDLSGTSQTTLQCTSGSWSPTATLSACLMECPAPTQPTANFLSFTISHQHYVENNVITYTCASGFTAFSGSAYLSPETNTCTSSGSWSVTSPRCAKDCASSPVAIATNGGFQTVPSPPFTPTTTAIYTCNSNYALSGTATTTCEDNGIWSVTAAPQCLDGCSSTPTASTGAGFSTPNVQPAKSFYAVSDIVTYTCLLGSGLSGGNTLTCNGNNAWTPAAAPNCRIACPSVPLPLKGAVQNQQTTYYAFDTVTYTCVVGYSSSSTTTTNTCQSGGTWLHNPAPFDCSPL